MWRGVWGGAFHYLKHTHTSEVNMSKVQRESCVVLSPVAVAQSSSLYCIMMVSEVLVAQE